MAAKIKKGDRVIVLAGKDKGRQGQGEKGGWSRHGRSVARRVGAGPSIMGMGAVDCDSVRQRAGRSSAAGQ